MGEQLGSEYSEVIARLEGEVRTATYDSQYAYEQAKVKYYQERAAAIAEGQPVWVIQNFDDEEIYQYDFYRERGYVGSIKEDIKGLTCRIYTADENQYTIEGPGRPIVEAVRILENKIV